MASVNVGAVGARRRLPINPWMWLGLGGSLTLWSYIWTLSFGEDASDRRVILLALGLFFTGVGVCLRWNDRQTVYIHTCAPGLAVIARLMLALVLGGVALGMTVLLGLAIHDSAKMAWKPGVTSLVWLSVAPVSLCAAIRCLKRSPGQVGLDAVEEIGLSLVLTALICIVGSLSLDLGGDFATDWDSIRLLLRVVTAVSLLGSALVLVTTRQRRLVVSMLIVLHFAGIATASLAAPPSPWLVQQVWVRIFRPYLEFMYLNNANHYYAPEPGPASYIWFRLIYTGPDEREFGWWYKLPELDERGKSSHTVAVEYQHFLAMTESASYTDPAPGAVFTNEKGELDTHEMFKTRLPLGLPASKKDNEAVGAQNKYLRIPLEPTVPHLQQVKIPNEASRRLLSSFARFVARHYATHPENPSLQFKSVKIYRVIHVIPPSQVLTSGIPPTDPELYFPYYMGNYEAGGTLIPEDDPYLYWLLPIMRENRNDPESKIRNFARLHAGDPHWVRPPLQFHQLNDPPPWGEPDDEDRKLVAP